MSPPIEGLPQEEEGGGIRQSDETKTLGNKSINKTKEKENRVYSKDLSSRFGQAFLPFATRLESVDEQRSKKKRRRKNKKPSLQKITNIPLYNEDKKDKKIKYHQHREENETKLNGKKKKNRSMDKDNDKLNWIGDTMVFDENWPNVDKRSTLRLFHINLNGITYQNELLEWDMTIAYLMDMQVDVFGLTEINLDMNNGIVKDNVLQSGRHFDPYLRMATSSSLQKLGESPFKMGGP